MAHTVAFVLFLFSVIFVISATISCRPSFLLRFTFPSSGQARVRTCDYSYGRWVRDETYACRSYSEDCQFLDPGFQCRRNGRNDTDYLNWRWQPYGCDLPRFNATEMLERSRNKRIVFAGDSIARNHWESLMCMLGAAVQNQSSIYEQHGQSLSKHTGAFFLMRFEDYNLTVEYYRTPYLVLNEHIVKKAIHVDRMQWQAKHWVDADVLIFHVGRWWSYSKITKKGYYFQEGNAIRKAMDLKQGFRRSLQTWKQWLTINLRPEKTKVFFGSYSPSHFMNGTWDTGGSCHGYKEPEAKITTHEESWENQAITDTIEGMKDVRTMVHLLNITYLANLRKDGHPSKHREPNKRNDHVEDCSHWCLPGVPDTWNEILYAYLFTRG